MMLLKGPFNDASYVVASVASVYYCSTYYKAVRGGVVVCFVVVYCSLFYFLP